MKALQTKVDNLEQTERPKKLILLGIKTEASTKPTAKTLNNLLRMKIKAEDIHYVIKLKTDSRKDEDYLPLQNAKRL